jgi:AAA+ superfamily predicted ATPase
MSDTTTKSQKQAADVASLLRARTPLLWIVTREEARVEGFLAEAAAAAGYSSQYFWDVAAGVTKLDGKPAGFGSADPGDTLNVIKDRALNKTRERAVWIMRDLPVWLQGPAGAAPTRALRNLARLLPGIERDNSQAIIVLTTSSEVPADLAPHATVIDWPLPDRAEIAAILDAAVTSLPENDKSGAPLRAVACPADVREIAIDSAVGLIGEEAASCYAKSLVQSKRIDAALVANEKKRVIAREKVLEWYDPIKGGLDAVGGLDALKKWLKARAHAYSPKAREYGLPSPKGAVLVGIPGCGKSLTAKAIATAWNVPLLKLDLGALKSKFVGDSEANLRKALRVIEAIGRCVVWLDEIEKALQGATSGSADGGVSADVLGTILSWMQERSGEAFVIATANDISALPPELLRKGRFDEVFFVDMPNHSERSQIVGAALREYGRETLELDFASIADATEDFTGAEIAALVPAALYSAFEEDAREITTADLIAAAKETVPLIKTAGEKIGRLRSWAKDGNARYATSQVVGSVATGRQLDV